MDHPLTIEQFQAHIRERYYQTDHARGTPATFMWFMEEVGELATALQLAAKQRETDPTDTTQARSDAQAHLAQEFADVLAWLCTLANINGVDLTEAVTHKYLTGSGPKGHK